MCHPVDIASFINRIFIFELKKLCGAPYNISDFETEIGRKMSSESQVKFEWKSSEKFGAYLRTLVRRQKSMPETSDKWLYPDVEVLEQMQTKNLNEIEEFLPFANWL